MSSQPSPNGRIAVVGLAVHYAGSRDKTEFWSTLTENATKTGPISEARLGSKRKSLHFVNSRPKYADTFNNDKYGCIDTSEGTLDNEHDLLLRLAITALEDMESRRDTQASTTNAKASRVGIVSGCLSFPSDRLQGELLNLYQQHMEKYLAQKTQKDVFNGDHTPWTTARDPETACDPKDKRFYMDPATFVADELGLGGVRYSVDAACASALYVLKLAQDHLLNPDSNVDVMLCGGVCFPEPFFILTGFSTFHAMPLENGVSMPLRKKTEGLTPGEGGSIMVLKRYEDAVRDGDKIYGSLLGCRLNNAGDGLPLTPHQASQRACLSECYEKIGLNPHMVQYVECHATGTPLGDVSECEAMRHVFEGRVPRFGSTKGNFGHTLVAAGFAGMAKVLLAMNQGVIPPTPGVDQDSVVDPKVVIQKCEPWPDVSDGRLKRAGLSAFGFGGTNAHAVFEEARGGLVSSPLPKSLRGRYSGKLSIIGMASHFGKFQSLDEFEHGIYEGLDASQPLPAKRWRFFSDDADFFDILQPGSQEAPRGCYVGEIDVDYKRLKTTLVLEDQLLPQQLLALSTIDQALIDSNIEKGGRVAVLVGLGTDLELYRHRARVALRERLASSILKDPESEAKLMDYVHDRGTSTSYTSYIGNLVATRISSQWKFTGPAFTVTEGANSVFRCVELAKMMLESGDCDAAVVAGVDMAAGAESIYVKTRRFPLDKTHDRPTAAFENSSGGYFPGEGCGAIVLRRVEDSSKDRVYCTVNAVSCSNSEQQAAIQALKSAGLQASDVDLIELSADSSSGSLRELRQVGLAYSSNVTSSRRLHAISTAKANVGHTGYASGAASLIRAALCLHNRYLPATPHWETPKDAEAFETDAKTFYVCPDSRAWVKISGKERNAGVSGSCEAGSSFHVILSDAPGQHEVLNRCSLPVEVSKLLVIRGHSCDAICDRIENELMKKATSDAKSCLRELLRETKENKDVSSPLALCLVTTAQKLQRELEMALKGVKKSFADGLVWQSPSGSCFTSRPLVNNASKVCFIYGDGAAPYPGLGRDIWRVVPSLHETTDEITRDMWKVPDDAWNPRCVTLEHHQVLRQQFMVNQVEMFRSGVFFSVLFTHVARNVLKIEPQAACGLSLGEISMLFAFSIDNSRKSDVLTERLTTSDVWTRELAGSMNALRNAWGFSQTTPLKEFWSGLLVRGTRQQVEVQIAKHEHVRALIINDDKTVLIAGVPSECLQVAQALECTPIPVPQGMCGHCKEVEPFKQGIEYIHEHVLLPDTSQVALYSSKSKKPLQGMKGSDCRKFVSSVYEDCADFPQTIEAVYRDGFDVFVEVGPNSHRTAAISSILNGRPHLAVALDKQGKSGFDQTNRMLAMLVTQRVPGVLPGALLHPKTYEPVPPPHPLQRTIVVNGRYLGLGMKDIKQELHLPEARPLKARMVGRAPVRPHTTPKATIASFKKEDDFVAQQPQQSNGEPLSLSTLKAMLLQLDKPVYFLTPTSISISPSSSSQGHVLPCTPSTLGDASFLQTYGVDYPLYTGAMAKGIASADLVVANGKRKILSSLGAGGLPLHLIKKALDQIQSELPNGPFMVNLIHSPFNENLERGCVDMLLERKVRFVEASAFMNLTLQVVRYRVKGLESGGPNGVVVRNRLIAKISRTELAEMFVKPAPQSMLDKLLEMGEITREQALLALKVPMCDDIAVEADSGGHTDNRPMVVILPMIMAVRDRIHKACGYPREFRVRVGAGGGIGCPASVLAAFQMGAAFVVTGSINQMSKQSGSSDIVRGQLSKATYSDITMAPAADMFDQGVQLQVLKKGTMFSARAKKLYELFVMYESLEAIPENTRLTLEKQVFRKPMNVIWQETEQYYRDVLKDEAKIAQAYSDPKLKMSLVFRWYLGLSSTWANAGVADRAMDYQVWCGPAIGSFNDFIRGSYLDPVVAGGKYPDVAQINMQIFKGACYLQRVRQLATHPRLSGMVDVNMLEDYKPEGLL